MKKSTDDNIERVFAALRQSDIPAGLEQRVLQAMQESQQRRSPLWLTAAGMAGAVAVAAAIYFALPKMEQRPTISREPAATAMEIPQPASERFTRHRLAPAAEVNVPKSPKRLSDNSDSMDSLACKRCTRPAAPRRRSL